MKKIMDEQVPRNETRAFGLMAPSLRSLVGFIHKSQGTVEALIIGHL